MYIVTICSLLALFFTFLESRKILRNGMALGFIIITTLACIRYNYGNDYMVYYRDYFEITNIPFNINNILLGQVYRDPGWAILCFAFKPIGGFITLVAVLSIVQNYIVYRFIKKNTIIAWWPASVFIYLFTSNLFLLQLSMMRQGFVVCVFLGLWQLICDKRWWYPLIILYLCSFIHQSAIILIPFAFWGFIPMEKSRILGYTLIILFVGLWISSSLVNSILQGFMKFEELQEYVNSYENIGKVGNYGLGFIISLIPFFITIYYLIKEKNKDSNLNKMVMLGSIGQLIVPFNQIIPLASRIGLYFSIYSLSTIPIVYSSIKKKTLKKGLFLLYILFILYTYYIFFTSSIYAPRYSEFNTIFDIL